MSPLPAFLDTPPRLAGLDIGSNTCSMVVVGREPGEARHRVLEDLSVVTSLGRDRGPDGALDPDSTRRTLTVLRLYRRRVQLMQVARVAAGATAAVRGAPDGGAAFVDEVRRRTAFEVSVLSGEQEAATSYIAADREFGDGGDLLLVDIGGGSTELVHGRAGAIVTRRSIPLGAVNTTEGVLGARVPPRPQDLLALRDAVHEGFRGLALPSPPGRLVAVAGTATTLLAVRDGIAPYDGERVHGQTLTAAELTALQDRIEGLPTDRIAALPGMETGRAPYAAAGACILRAVYELLGTDEAIVGDRGLRYGLLYVAYPRLRIE